jgi:hypothetical protein
VAFVLTWVKPFAPELAHAMSTVHSMLAGCVRVERSIKVQQLVHSKLRNRQLHRKVEKLASIYMNARLLNSNSAILTALEEMAEASAEDEARMELALAELVEESTAVAEE